MTEGTAPTDPMQTLLDMISSMIERTPGATVTSIAHRGNRIVIRMTGRGPGLHETRLVALLPFGGSTLGDDALRTLSTVLTLQADRRSAARALGLPDDEPAGLGAFDHMVVDAFLCELVEEQGDDRGTSVRDMLDTYIAGGALVREDNDAVNSVYKRDGIVIRDGDGGDVRPRVMIYRDYDEFAFDGEMLVVRGQFPDTIANAVAGRSVGEIVELPGRFSRLHSRRIIDAENLGPALALRTEAEWIALP